MTSSELAVENKTAIVANAGGGEYVGVARPRFEILAGCVQVDDDRVSDFACANTTLERLRVYRK